MLKKIIATAILVVSLHADVEKFQVLANKLVTKDDIVIAKGNVVAFSPTYYITAQKAIYDKKKGTFELFDDVVILKNNNVQTKSNYSFLDLNTDDSYQKPSLYFEESNSIWISSKDAKKTDDILHLESSTLSSCDCVDPDWSIKFSSADYDTEDKWINIYNPRLYLKDVPLFYAPYIGFSTDKTRRTGLLVPTIGYTSSEGAFYSQPIYIAPADNYDIELVPEYRIKRTKGIKTYFRYADSINSMFKLSLGYFKDFQTYADDNVDDSNYYGREHYGIGLDYVRRNMLSSNNKLGYEDALYVDINYLNDSEYQDLEDGFEDDDDSQKVESKINYIYNTPSFLLGSYFRYYIDVEEESNSATLQELPKLQAHTYSKPFFLDNLLYSTDLKYTNYDREDGINAQQYEFNAPISYSIPLLNDYLTLGLKQEFTVNKYEYSNSDTDFEDGTYAESKSTISLNSDLIKPYDNYVHTVNLFADYNRVHTISEDGDLYVYGETDNPSTLSPSFAVTKSEDNVEIGINHSLYDRENYKQIINHKLTQKFSYDDYDNFESDELENEIKYNYILGSMSNKIVYNYKDEDIVESSSSFSLSYDNFYLSLGHYLSRETDNSGLDELESYTLTSRYKLSDKYLISYYTNYNIQEELRTKNGIMFTIKDSCWDLNLKYEREIDSDESQDILYVQLFLKPIGGIQQQYTVNKEERDNQ